MAQRPSVVTAEVTSVPDPTEISRVADFVREPFVEEDEEAAAVLAPGSIRRHAFEAARAELDAGAEVPSQKWRRRWSLLLGLDRTLNATTPVLADGTTLNPHQIDALSGTYAALLADAQRRARGGSGSDGDALLLSFEDEDPTELEEPPAQVTAEDDDEGHDDGHDDEGPSVDEDGDELESIDEQLVELPDAEPESESSLYDDVADEDVDEDIDRVALDDPNAHKRFWFEHATGAGKTVAAMGFVEACRTGGILILTHRRNLVDQFQDELRTRGYGERLSKPLLTDADGNDPNPDVIGPVTIETYQWFVRNAGRISGAYTVVICDEAHTALGDKTSAAIRAWTGPIFIGMTATGALIARHVADLFPTQTSRFDLAQAARRGVIAPLRCLRIPPGPGVRTIAKVPLRKGEVDMEFDQDELAKLLDQAPFNLAIADLYKTRFRNTPGVVYTAGVQHAYNVAESFRALGMKAMAVSGETPKRELATILADYDAGEIDVLINAQLLAEGWNSPRATICMHLAPTASKRIYQQRVGRVTRRHPGKEAGVVIDFVHPATANDDPVVTLHSLLDRDVYRGGAIVVGPVRRGRGRRVKVERRVLPVTPDIERRRQVFERELWRIAVEQLDWGEQRVWAALAGAKASPANWRRGRAMLNFDRSGELRRQFLITALERNRSPQLRMRAIQEIALLREAEPFDTAIDFIGQWPRDERREASRTMLQAMADRRIGRRDQATAWIWRLAEYTRDVHEEYAAQRWPATKHLLGLLVNSSGAAHARNARRLVHGARQHDRRLQAALLAAAVAHTPEAEEVLREARTRLARKPGALSRDLLKDFPNGKRRKKRTRKRRGGGGANGEDATTTAATDGPTPDTETAEGSAANGGSAENGNGNNGNNGNGQNGTGNGGSSRSRRGRSRGGRRRNRGGNGVSAEATPQGEVTPQAEDVPVDVPAGSESSSPPVREPDVSVPSDDAAPTRRRRMRGQKAAAEAAEAAGATPEGSDAASTDAASSDAEASPEPAAEPKPAAARTRTRTRKTAAEKTAEATAAAASGTDATAAAPVADAPPADATEAAPAEKPVRRTRTRKTAAEKAAEAEATPISPAAETPVEKPVRATRTRKTAAQKAAEAATAAAPVADAAPVETAVEAIPAAKPVRATRTRKTVAQKAAEAAAAETAAPEATLVEKPVRAPRTRKTAAQKAAEAAAVDDVAPAAKPAARRTTTRKTAAQKAAEAGAATPEAAEAAPATKPVVRKTATRKTAAQKAAEAAAADGAVDAPAKKPATRRTTAAAKATTATKTPATTAAKKPATRKTAAQKAAEAAAATPEAAETAPAKKPATRKTTAKATTTAAAKTTTTARKSTTAKATTPAAKKPAAKVTTTAAKKPAARKPAAAKSTAAAKTTATKTTAARKPATRRTAAPKPDKE